jgi:hypothetical protein
VTARIIPALALIAAASVEAQSVASFQILADSSRVVCGRKTKVTAITRGPNGDKLDFSYRWTVSDARLASIEFDGTLTALRPGIVRVRATITNNLWSETVVQLLPDRITLDPPSAELSVGEKRQFTARVLDASGNAIPDVALRWQVLTGVGFNSNAASISTAGALEAFAEGDLIVRAAFVYNTYIPGMQNQVDAEAPLRIRPARAYQLSRVAIQRGPATRARLVYRPSMLAMNDGGALLFNASAGGTTTGLITHGDRGWQFVASAGTPGAASTTAAYEFYSFAINDRGDVVTTGAMLGSGNVLYRGTRAGLDPAVWDDVPLTGGAYEGIRSARLSRTPLADDGSMAFQANFRRAGETATFNGLFRMAPDGEVRLAASTESALDPLGGVPTFDADGYGPAPGDLVYFLATANGRRGLFRQRNTDKPVKLIASGDSFGDGTVNTLMGASMFWVGPNGDVVVGVQASNGNWLLRLPEGDVTRPGVFRLSGWNAVHSLHPRHGVLFQGSEPGQPNGLILWNDTTHRMIFQTNRTQVAGATIERLDGAALDGSGTVYALVQTAASPQSLVRFGDQPEVLLRMGDEIEASPVDGSWSFLLGGKVGGPHLLASGFYSSVLDLESGVPRTALEAGERITGAFIFTGAAWWNSRRGNDGHIYVTQTAGYGVSRKAAGKPIERVLAPTRPADDGATLNSPSELRINAAGNILSVQGTNRGDSRMALTRGGTVLTVVSNNGSTVVEGLGAVAAWGEYMLDDRDRVLALLRGRNGQLVLALWTQGEWRIVWRPGDSVGRWTALNISNLKTVDDRFFFRIQIPGGTWAIAELRDDAPRVVLDVDEPGANGIPVNNTGLFDVNRRGDLFFQSFAFGQTSYGVKTASGHRHIYTTNGATSEGDVLARLIDVDLRDDGTAWMIFITLTDEPAVYRAAPLR